MCGLDPRRVALDGSEMRSCWIGTPQHAEPTERRWAGSPQGRVPGDAVGRGYASGATAPAATFGAAGLVAGGRRPRTFVPVDDPSAAAAEAPEVNAGPPAPLPVTQVPGMWWLWGDPEPWPET